MEAIEVRKAAAELRAIWVLGNEYLQAAAPWTMFKEDPDQRRRHRAAVAEPDPVFTRCCRAPFIPDAAGTLLAAMKTDDAGWPDDLASRADRPAGRPCL